MHAIQRKQDLDSLYSFLLRMFLLELELHDTLYFKTSLLEHQERICACTSKAKMSVLHPWHPSFQYQGQSKLHNENSLKMPTFLQRCLPHQRNCEEAKRGFRFHGQCVLRKTQYELKP